MWVIPCEQCGEVFYSTNAPRIIDDGGKRRSYCPKHYNALCKKHGDPVRCERCGFTYFKSEKTTLVDEVSDALGAPDIYKQGE